MACVLACLGPATPTLAQEQALPAERPADAQAGDAADAPPATRPDRPPASAPPRFVYSVGQGLSASRIGHIDGGGEATTTTTTTDFSLTWLASRRTRVTFKAANELAFYDFDSAFGLDPTDGDPFGRFSRQSLDVLASHALNERWAILALGGASFARERDADLGQSLGWRLGVVGTYALSPSVSIGLGLVLSDQPEQDLQLLPLPQISATFRLDPRWTLNLGTLEGLALTYQASERLAFELRAGYEERLYRLDDSGPAPDGVFQDKAIDLQLAASWQPAPGLTLRAGVGTQPWRRFKIKDRDGNRLGRAEADPSATLFAQVTYRF